jgi:hypothetical protein
MIHPDKATVEPPDMEDDDDDLDLPDSSSELQDEEGWEPDDDSDLGLQGDDDDEDSDGLDDDSELEDASQSDALVGDDEEDATSWLDDGSGRDSEALVADDDDELAELESDGSSESSEAVGALAGEDWDDPEIDLDEDAPLIGDGGEEGFGDESVLSGLDLDRLPPLDDAGEAGEGELEADPFAADLLAALASDIGAEEALELVAPGIRCARLPAAQVELELMLQPGHPLRALLAAGDVGLGWHDGLCVAEASADRAERRDAGGSVLLALAGARVAGATLIALSSPEGVRCSSDAGRSFSVAHHLGGDDGSSAVASLAITRGASGAQLWAAAPEGALWRSDDLGASFERVRDDVRVLRLVSDGERQLIALGRARDGTARALRSSDGGRAFGTLALPVTEVERVQDLQTCHGVTLCCRRSPTPQLLWKRDSQDWSELAESAQAPACLIDEDGDVKAYFFVRDSQRVLLLRRALRSMAATPQLVCELPVEAGAALQLVGSCRDGVTWLHVGTERAWYRLSVRLDAGGRD